MTGIKRGLSRLREVKYPRLKRGSLCLGSTATRRSANAVPLWSHRSAHRAQLTTDPS
jgi:hypothetical protein